MANAIMRRSLVIVLLLVLVLVLVIEINAPRPITSRSTITITMERETSCEEKPFVILGGGATFPARERPMAPRRSAHLACTADQISE
jgi:hypothetical protein